MDIKRLICGEYEENCYLVKVEDGYVAIDPGDGAYEQITSLGVKILAVLNTHGHFDHIWDNACFNAPIYIHEKDAFMLDDPFGMGHPKSIPAKLMQDKTSVVFGGVEFCFHHFAGHTPGCCMIEIVGENIAFSGDFLFKGCIGRYDFPYSNPSDMKQSLLKVKSWENDLKLLPGHGTHTYLKQENLDFWLKRM